MYDEMNFRNAVLLLLPQQLFHICFVVVGGAGWHFCSQNWLVFGVCVCVFVYVGKVGRPSAKQVGMQSVRSMSMKLAV